MYSPVWICHSYIQVYTIKINCTHKIEGCNHNLKKYIEKLLLNIWGGKCSFLSPTTTTPGHGNTQRHLFLLFLLHSFTFWWVPKANKTTNSAIERKLDIIKKTRFVLQTNDELLLPSCRLLAAPNAKMRTFRDLMEKSGVVFGFSKPCPFQAWFCKCQAKAASFFLLNS